MHVCSLRNPTPCMRTGFEPLRAQHLLSGAAVECRAHERGLEGLLLLLLLLLLLVALRAEKPSLLGAARTLAPAWAEPRVSPRSLGACDVRARPPGTGRGVDAVATRRRE